MDMLDIYTDYLICQNKYATATGLSDMVDDEISHDKVTRFLRQGDFDSMLWKHVKPAVRERETQNGVLILDDSIEDKPYTDENEVNCWHYSHAKGDVVKGINVLSCMVRYDDFSLPIGYEIIKKYIQYSDIKTQKLRRKATINKNQIFRQLIQQACTNHVNWFGSKANMAFIHDELQKSFIIGVKSNRTLALSEDDAKNGSE
ncbi:MAG: transposase [Legionellaceae bacterium]|nr:transposase [Legionellaceae bacterium]